MSRKRILVFSYIIIFLVVAYFGYQAVTEVFINDATVFFNVYYDSFAKYLFTNTILVLPVLYVSQTNYLDYEINIRMRNRCVECVWENNFRFILFHECMILFFFLLVTLVCRFDHVFYMFSIDSFFRSLLFTLWCFIMRELVYYNTKNQSLAVGTVLSVNFFLKIIVLGIEWYVPSMHIAEEVLMNLFAMFMAISSLAGFVFLYFRMDRKEIVR